MNSRLKKLADAVKGSSNLPRVKDLEPYREHVARIAVLKERRQELAVELLHAEQAASTPVQAERVARVMAGESVEAVDVAADERTEAGRLRYRIDLLDTAISRMERAALLLEAQARKRVYEAARARQIEIGQRMASILIELSKAQIEAFLLHDELQDAGAGDWPVATFGPLGLGRIGDPRAEESLPAQWMVAAIAAGLIEANAVPSEWRAGWGVLQDVKLAKDTLRGSSARMKVSRYAAEASAPNARARSADRAARRAGRRG